MNTKRLVLMLCVFLTFQSPQCLADDVGKYIQLHQNSIDGIWSIHSTFSLEVTNVDHSSALDKYSVEYFAENDQERLITRRPGQTITGDFTKNKYDIGIVDVSNGVKGFCRVKNFDGTTDAESGLLPVDSPASATIGAKTYGTLGFLARVYLGFEIVCDTKPKPCALKDVFQVAEEKHVEVKGNIIEITCITSSGKLMVQLDSNLKFMMTGFLVASENGDVSSFKYEKFEKQNGVLLPTAFEQKAGKLRGVGVINYHSVNTKLSDGQMIAFMPSGIPFHDRTKDTSGIWGTGEPLFLFSSNEEAKNWDVKRKKEYHLKSTKANSSFGFMATGSAVAAIGFIMAIILWRLRL